MNYAENQDYRAAFTSSVTGTTFYTLQAGKPLPFARQASLEAQGTFAGGAITRDALEKICKEAHNNLTEKKSITDQAIYWNNILYRCRFPIDEDVCLRAAAAVVFIDGEDPEKCEGHSLDRKVILMKQDDEVYTFFLTMGCQIIPSYKPFASDDIRAYVKNRKSALAALVPQ